MCFSGEQMAQVLAPRNDDPSNKIYSNKPRALGMSGFSSSRNLLDNGSLEESRFGTFDEIDEY